MYILYWRLAMMLSKVLSSMIDIHYCLFTLIPRKLDSHTCELNNRRGLYNKKIVNKIIGFILYINIMGFFVHFNLQVCKFL